jgi:hypothetical protein
LQQSRAAADSAQRAVADIAAARGEAWHKAAKASSCKLKATRDCTAMWHI